MRDPLRLAWLGQRSLSAGDGLLTYSREITRGLRQRGVEVVFVHHEDDEVADDSVALPALKVSPRFRIAAPGSSRRLGSALSERRIDLVHVSLSFSSLDFTLPDLCHRLGLPIVATLHAPFDTHPTAWGFLSKLLYRIYAPPLARMDCVIVFGPQQRQLVTRSGVPEAVQRIVPNGVDVLRYSPGPSSAGAELGAARLFLYMGRLDPEKKVDVLLEAFLAVRPPRRRGERQRGKRAGAPLP